MHTALLRAAGRVIGSDDDPERRTAYCTIGLARPSIRTDNSGTEVLDRLTRLLRIAHRLPRRDHVGAGTLADLAAASIVTTQAALTALRGVDADSPLIPRIETRLTHWRQTHLELRQLRTSAPRDPLVHADVSRLHLLVRAQPTLGWTRDDSLDAVRITDRLDRYVNQTTERQAQLGNLLVQARTLPRDLISDRPDLAAAHLADQWVPSVVTESPNTARFR